MAIFGHRTARQQPGHVRHEHKSSTHGNHEQYYTMATRPTFGQWLKHTLLDILTMAAMGAIGLGVSLHSYYMLTIHPT